MLLSLGRFRPGGAARGHKSTGYPQVVAAGTGVGDNFKGEGRSGFSLITCIQDPTQVLVGIRPRLGGDNGDLVPTGLHTRLAIRVDAETAIALEYTKGCHGGS